MFGISNRLGLIALGITSYKYTDDATQLATLVFRSPRPLVKPYLQ